MPGLAGLEREGALAEFPGGGGLEEKGLEAKPADVEHSHLLAVPVERRTGQAADPYLDLGRGIRGARTAPELGCLWERLGAAVTPVGVVRIEVRAVLTHEGSVVGHLVAPQQALRREVPNGALPVGHAY